MEEEDGSPTQEDGNTERAMSPSSMFGYVAYLAGTAHGVVQGRTRLSVVALWLI